MDNKVARIEKARKMIAPSAKKRILENILLVRAYSHINKSKGPHTVPLGTTEVTATYSREE